MCNNYDWTMLPLCFMFYCEFSAFSYLKTTEKTPENANFLRFFLYYFKIFAILFANTNNYFYLCLQRNRRSAVSRLPLYRREVSLLS